jgi:hypothetical protein
MTPPKFLGASWQTALSGIFIAIGGLGTIISHSVFAGAPWAPYVELISEIVLLVSGSYGVAKAKSVHVTGIVTNNPATTTATSNPAFDGTTAPTPPPTKANTNVPELEAPAVTAGHPGADPKNKLFPN